MQAGCRRWLQYLLLRQSLQAVAFAISDVQSPGAVDGHIEWLIELARGGAVRFWIRSLPVSAM
jgi:hypothetical protein